MELVEDLLINTQNEVTSLCEMQQHVGACMVVVVVVVVIVGGVRVVSLEALGMETIL